MSCVVVNVVPVTLRPQVKTNLEGMRLETNEGMGAMAEQMRMHAAMQVSTGGLALGQQKIATAAALHCA